MNDLFARSVLRHFRVSAVNDGFREDDGDGVVEDGFAEHQHVEDGVDVQGLEDGEGRHGIHGAD